MLHYRANVDQIFDESECPGDNMNIFVKKRVEYFREFVQQVLILTINSIADEKDIHATVQCAAES